MRKRINPADVAMEHSSKPAESYEKVEPKYSAHGLSLNVESLTPIQTAADAMEKAGLDPARWEPIEIEASSWTVPVKKKAGDGSNTIEEVECWRVKIRCKPLLPDWAYTATNRLTERIKGLSGPFPPVKYSRKRKGRCVLEIAISDIHAGKFAIDGTWSLAEFETAFARTVDFMIDKCVGRNLAEIILPIGNDMLNVDTAMMTTTRGTPQGGRCTFADIYSSSMWATIRAVERCREVAPVRVIHVPGNHDWSSSRHVVEAVGAVFHKTKGVSVDLSEEYGGGRKYYHNGVILIGYAHGNNEKATALPGIMANEVPELWSQATCREFHIGHRHFRSAKRTKYSINDAAPYLEHEGVLIRQLSSISPDDHYHKIQGYVGSARVNEAFLYDLDFGIDSVFTVPYARVVGK
ncbi:MAG: hypothetical protein NXI04_18880 [Planctomycetaceae bacterium]|nr:hypothetical protein [Planctomycetaceae bacterium]